MKRDNWPKCEKIIKDLKNKGAIVIPHGSIDEDNIVFCVDNMVPSLTISGLMSAKNKIDIDEFKCDNVNNGDVYIVNDNENGYVGEIIKDKHFDRYKKDNPEIF